MASKPVDPIPMFDDVAALLVRFGVVRAYTVASVHNLRVLEALAAAGVEIVSGRSELGAASMADGYARSTGLRTPFITSTGPGAGNAIGAFATAAKDGSPVIHISTTNYKPDGAYGLHHVDEQHQWMRAFGTPSVDLAVADLSDIEKALADRPGAISILLPSSGTTEGDAPYASGALERPVDRLYELRDMDQPASGMSHIDRWLRSESRVLLIGAGARSIGIDRLEQFASLADCGVVTTVQAKDLFSPEHPRFLGCTLMSPRVALASKACSVGLALGTRLNEMSTFGWGDVLPPLVIRVDLNGEQVGLEHSRVITVQADVDDVVTYATDQLHANPPHRSEPEDSHDQQAARGGVERDYLDVIGANLRAGDFIVCDMTKLGFWAIQALHLPKYARFLFPGLLTMGWGLPAAIGAAAGSPTSHVVLIVGDGGLLSILSELDLCKTLHGRLSIVLVDDDGYYMLQSQISEDLQGPTCEFPGPSWPDIAKAFSIPFFDVGTDPEVLSDVLSADHTGSRIVRIDGRTISRGFRYA